MVDAQTSVALGVLAEIVPEGVDPAVRPVNREKAVGPPLLQQLEKRFSGFRSGFALEGNLGVPTRVASSPKVN